MSDRRDELIRSTPFALVASARPSKVETPSGRGRSSAADYKVKEFTASSSIQVAESNRSEIIEHHLRRFESGEIGAVYRLLDLNPEFAADERVRQALLAAEDHRRRRGRPRGRSAHSRTLGLIIVLLVECRAAQDGVSKHKVMEQLTVEGFEGLDYDRIKQMYYQFRNDTRLTPYLVRFEAHSRVGTRSELAQDPEREHLLEQLARDSGFAHRHAPGAE